MSFHQAGRLRDGKCGKEAKMVELLAVRHDAYDDGEGRV